MNKILNNMHCGEYVSPQCDVLALEGGAQVLDNGSSNLPIVVIATEEEW
ncbi:MAG: hypothetical protein IK008_02205 [Bacteroidales bacterium]|nr:hypothetical protein [Bacteroidales bacterium]